MPKIITLMLAVSTLFLLAACSNQDKAASEFIEYYNEEWIPMNAMKKEKMREAQDKLSEIESNQGEDLGEKAVALYKTETIPSFDEVLEQLESVELEHSEVKKVNKLQIEAEEFARTHLEKGIDYFKGTISDTEYRAHENELKEKYDTVLDYQDELIEKYDLEYEKKKGKVDGFYELKIKKD